MIAALVWFVIFLAALALVYWAVSKLPLPPVAMIVAQFVLGLIALVGIGKLLIGVIGSPPGF